MRCVFANAEASARIPIAIVKVRILAGENSVGRQSAVREKKHTNIQEKAKRSRVIGSFYICIAANDTKVSLREGGCGTKHPPARQMLHPPIGKKARGSDAAGFPYYFTLLILPFSIYAGRFGARQKTGEYFVAVKHNNGYLGSFILFCLIHFCICSFLILFRVLQHMPVQPLHRSK